MKSALVLCLLFALLELSMGFKNGVCGLRPGADGNGKIKCVIFVPKWSYYSEENTCKEFTFGGCGGNDNRFNSEESCRNTCVE